jgi:succinate-acetate transporter protein
MNINVKDLDNRCVTTSTVGYMCLALASWMMSMTSARWYAQAYPHGVDLLVPFAILLAIVGILAYLHGRSLDAIVFFGSAGLFVASRSAGLAVMGGATEPASYLGWFWAMWTIFFGYVWLGSFRAGLPRQLFLLGISLTFLAKALFGWTDQAVFSVISGYLGLITAIIAAVVSASDVIVFGREAHSPNDDHEAGHARAA